MDTTQTAAALATAVADRTEKVAYLETITRRGVAPRTRSHAMKAVEVADQTVRFATSDHEQAERRSMAGAPEADIMAAVYGV